MVMFEEGQRQMNNRLGFLILIQFFFFFLQVLILFKLILLEKKVRFDGWNILHLLTFLKTKV